MESNIPKQLADHFSHVYFGGNWTVSNLKEQLSDVTWEEATSVVPGVNTIAVLFFHIHYFVRVQLKVLEGGPLEGSDKLSFNVPPIQSEEEWQLAKADAWREAERMAALMAELDERQLCGDFVDPKYGSYYRNLAGIVEHTHYHLGQISLIKKLLRQPNG